MPREKLKTLLSCGWGVSLPLSSLARVGTRRLEEGRDGALEPVAEVVLRGRRRAGMKKSDVVDWVLAMEKVAARAMPLRAIQLRVSRDIAGIGMGEDMYRVGREKGDGKDKRLFLFRCRVRWILLYVTVRHGPCE